MTPAAWMLLGAAAAWLVEPGAVFYPPARLFRGLLVTARVESAFDPNAVGDGGASVGILQFNDANAGLVDRQDWRLSPYYSGVAAVRYLMRRPLAQLRATTAAGLPGLAAWRSLWVSGDALAYRDEPLRPSDVHYRYVGPLALRAWARTAGLWWASALVWGLWLLPLATTAAPVVLGYAMLQGFRWGMRDDGV